MSGLTGRVSGAAAMGSLGWRQSSVAIIFPNDMKEVQNVHFHRTSHWRPKSLLVKSVIGSEWNFGRYF